MSEKVTFHLGLKTSDIRGAKVAILPGDPGRVPTICAAGTNAEPLAHKREFNSALIEVNGSKVVVCSTGIGGPSTSIAVEELAQLGVDTFLRVGTTGALQPDIKVGDVIISTAAVRLDGASRHFAPMSYPAAADYECVHALVSSAKATGLDYHVGISAASDTFYPGQERYDTVSGYVLPELQGSADQWQQLNVLNFEMESATLFTMCSANGWRSGMVAGVLVNRHHGETPDPAAHASAVNNSVRVVLDAAASLTTDHRHR